MTPTERQTQQRASDAMTEKSITFTIGKRKFSIKPPTLGKMQILSRHYLSLEIDDKAFEDAPHTETMRVCESHTDIVCALMATAVSNTREELMDDEKQTELAEWFKWNCSPQDFSSIILAILTQVDYVGFITSIRLTETLRQNKPRE